ncbi:MAG: hypothetical protein EDM75_16235, partial [Chlorobiota bacterium]
MLKHLFRTIILFFIPAALFAQVSNYITGVELTDAREGLDLTVKVNLTNINEISDITLAYRVFGTSEFIREDMDLAGGLARVTIPAEKIKVPSLEYYFIIDTRNNGEEYYPIDAMNQNFLRVQVQPKSEKDDEIIVLNPDPGSPMSIDEALVTISLLKASDEVDKSKTKIFINGNDISSSMMLAEDLIIIAGDNLSSSLKKGGLNSMRVELYKADGSGYHAYSAGFEVTDQAGGRVAGTSLEYFLNVRAESRNENVRDYSSWYNNISIDGKATYGAFDMDALVYATSE